MMSNPKINNIVAPYPFTATALSYQQLAQQFDWQMAEKMAPKPNNNDDDMIQGISNFEHATRNHLIYINHLKYLDLLAQTKSRFCLITPKLYQQVESSLPDIHLPDIQFLLCAQPRKEWAKAAHALYPDYPFIKPQQKTANIADDAQIGAYTFIDDNCTISQNTVIGSNCSIINSFIGKNCIIGSNVSLHHCKIGDNNVILSGAVLGEEGFGIIPANGEDNAIPMKQIGFLETKSDVLIGSNSTVDRATIGKTFIDECSKIDSNVHIGHNVQIGKNCLLVACVGIGGSAKLGDNVAVGGCSTVKDHITIANGVEIGAGTVVYHSVTQKQLMFGVPARPFAMQARINLLLDRMVKGKKGR
ncbi:MAG: UDP-3-O-(3-hydroxymyristoyl)glucosamine N-acyltransferase [Alphaproteobacteria bacterium]|nr:UDP-3-O-(3-hydroxymyristoyl)glucosamine N-acyltransferase [Alphaproteobacteria bacterium]